MKNKTLRRKYQSLKQMKAILTKVVLAIMFIILCHSKSFSQTDPTVYPEYKAVMLYHDPFWENSNTTIINNVKNKGFNTIILSIRISQSAYEPDSLNLGLRMIPRNGDTSAYQRKVVSFIDSAYRNEIKVIAMNFEMSNVNQNMNYNKEKILRKIRYLSYYQKNVRVSEAYNFGSKFAHFDGVYADTEPWTLKDWKDDKYPGYDMCDSIGRVNNNAILLDYLSTIVAMKKDLHQYGFYSPLVDSGNTLQELDTVFMGAVQWNWHYFSQVTNEFPYGNFQLYCVDSCYDMIAPLTYCPKPNPDTATNSCMRKDCYYDSICSLCYWGLDSNLVNRESVGKCHYWFEKHFFGDHLSPSMSLLPLDAAPMLIGHSAYVADSYMKMSMLWQGTRYRARTCHTNSNYRGFFIYAYEKLFELPQGLTASEKIDCQAIPDNILPPDSTNQREIIVYPNPAWNFIRLKGLYPGDEIMIFSKQSELMLITELDEIDVSSLEPGYYFLIVRDLYGDIINRQVLSKNCNN